MNNKHVEITEPINPLFVHKISASERRILFFFLKLTSIGAGALAFTLTDEPLFIRCILGFFAVIFMIPSFNKKNWQEHILFFANEKGIIINPDNNYYTRPTTHLWLFIPWDNVMTITSEKVWHHGSDTQSFNKALALTLRITDDDHKTYFADQRNLDLAKKKDLSTQYPTVYFFKKIKDPHIFANRLNDLKRKYGS